MQQNPSNTEEVQEAVLAALSAGKPLELVGGGSKRFYGRPVKAETTLSLCAFTGVVDHQPEELILVVRPGTPLKELEETLARAGQMLAFEPPHWGEGATIGGAFGCNLAGPRRFQAGAARDHLLGFQAVTGRGEVIRGGGKVVKNVTGYDLSKLMCGSFGTLAVLTEVVVKVLPRPESERTLLVRGLTEDQAVALMSRTAGSANDPSAMAHLPAELSLPAPMGSGPMTLFRVEGPEPSVAYRAEGVVRMAEGEAETVEGEASTALWRAVRELEPVPLRDGERLWRFSLPPADSAAFVAGLRKQHPLRALYDWGGAQVWACMPAGADTAGLHQAARDAGGHARIVRGMAPGGEDVPVFPALAPAQQQLHRNLKNAFDPAGILNPGRMYPDF